MKHLLGKQLLKPRVLVLQRFKTPGVGHIHAAVFGLELVEGRSRDPVRAADIGRLRAGLLFLQHPNNLFFREP